MKTDGLADRTKLLRIEIVLKLYIVSLVLCGCLFLEFMGLLSVFKVPIEALGISLFFFVFLNSIYLYFLKKAIPLSRLYVYVGATDIVF